MNNENLFVGRRDELRLWQDVLADSEGQAVLVVGQQGMGKTFLVNKMAELDLVHPSLKVGAVRYEVTPTDPPNSTMLLMLDNAFAAAGCEPGSFDLTEQRRRQWASIFAILPKGKELLDLASSLRCDPTRHIREQFVERLHLISKRMPDNGRAIFVIDPEKYLPEDSADSWRLVVQELPPKIKFLFAQRKNDQLATNRDFICLPNVRRIPPDDLDVLDDQAAEELTKDFAPKISSYTLADVRDAVAVYKRHPYALPAALKMLASGVPIDQFPRDPTPEGVAKAQWRLVGERGAEAIRFFRAYAVLEVAVHDEIANEVAGVDSAVRESLLADEYLSGLLRLEPDGRRIYHSLLAGHILECLSAGDAKSLHRRAVQAYRPCIEREMPDAIAAKRLPEHVFEAEGAEAFRNSVLECFKPLINLGLLDECMALGNRALQDVEQGTPTQAAIIGNLGLIYKDRGDLDAAEKMHRQALDIHEKLGRLEGMANAYGNLGLIYRSRGDLDGAEKMHRQSLEIEEKLGRLEGMAATYGNLGVIYRIRGDLDAAEKMHRQALEINEKLGRLEGMAINYGNLGLIYQDRGDLDGAEKMLRQALEINEKLGRLEGMAAAYGNLGGIYEDRGDISRARECWEKARELYRRIGMPHMVERIDNWLAELPPG